MGDLSRHFGTDASVEPAAQKELSAWLAANAGNGRKTRAQPPEDRITRSDWFVREHREVSRAVWSRPSVKSAANCSACHTQADRGDYDEHAVRIPR
jgi:nitrate/TMAO reductase-like tetraheme cytochrome c subunit